MENETQNSQTPKSAQGGWVPSNRSVVLGTVLSAVCAAISPVAFTQLPKPIGTVVGMVTLGIGTGLAAWLGMQSAGPRKSS